VIAIPEPTPIILTADESSLLDSAIEGTYDCAMSGEGNPAPDLWATAVEGLWASLHSDMPQPSLTPNQAALALDMALESDSDDEATYASLINKLTAIAY